MMVEGSLSLRVCAMYGFNRKVFISLAIAALTTVGLGAVRCDIPLLLKGCMFKIFCFQWAVIGPETVLETSQPGCHVTTPKSQSVHVYFPV